MASPHLVRDTLRRRQPWGPSRAQDIDRALAILQQLRHRGWTQEEIAVALGLSLRTASRWLNGEAKPSLLATQLVLERAKEPPVAARAPANRSKASRNRR